MSHKIYFFHFLEIKRKNHPPFLPTNKKYVKKTDIELRKSPNIQVLPLALAWVVYRWLGDRAAVGLPFSTILFHYFLLFISLSLRLPFFETVLLKPEPLPRQSRHGSPSSLPACQSRWAWVVVTVALSLKTAAKISPPSLCGLPVYHYIYLYTSLVNMESSW